jgi:hypothetical protein
MFDLRWNEFDQGAAQPSTRVIDNDVWHAESALYVVEETCHLIGVDGVTGEGLRARFSG